MSGIQVSGTWLSGVVLGAVLAAVAAGAASAAEPPRFTKDEEKLIDEALWCRDREQAIVADPQVAASCKATVARVDALIERFRKAEDAKRMPELKARGGR